MKLEDERVILGLGGNVGGDDAILARFAGVVAAFEAWSTVRASRVYRTAAIGMAQDDFLNAAIEVEAPEDLKASALIREVLAIEQAHGRRRGGERAGGPRAIDVDVLMWGSRVLALGGAHPLAVPHPRMHERAFALQPLIDLVGAAIEHPSLGRTLGELRAAVGDQRIAATDYAIAGAVAATAG